MFKTYSTLSGVLALALLATTRAVGAAIEDKSVATTRAGAALDALLYNFWSTQQQYLRRCAANASDVDTGGDSKCSEVGHVAPPLPPPQLQCDHKSDCCAGLPEKEREQCATREGCAARLCCWDDSHGPKNFCSPPPKVERKLTGYWNYQEALHAVALGATFDSTKYGAWVRRLVDAQFKQGTGWRVDYYDDMNWAVLALLAVHDVGLDSTQDYLDLAQTVFGYVSAAWDDSVCGGGVWWDKRHTQKATASNAGPALSAALLFNATGNVTYLEWGQRVYGFWNATMTDPQTGAVTDHYNTDGTPPSPSPPPVHHNCSHLEDCCGALPRGSPAYKECTTPNGCESRGCCWDENNPPHNWCSGKTNSSAPSPQVRGSELCTLNHASWTYNEGLMLGAATALAAATAQSNDDSTSDALQLQYAADAARFASHLVSSQTEQKHGRVLVDSCDWGETPCHDCSQFKGIAYRELGRWLRSPLAAASTERLLLKQSVHRLLHDSAALVWEGRQEGTRWDGPLFATGWALGSRKSCPPSLSSQASATHALLGHAAL